MRLEQGARAGVNAMHGPAAIGGEAAIVLATKQFMKAVAFAAPHSVGCSGPNRVIAMRRRTNSRSMAALFTDRMTPGCAGVSVVAEKPVFVVRNERQYYLT